MPQFVELKDITRNMKNTQINTRLMISKTKQNKTKQNKKQNKTKKKQKQKNKKTKTIANMLYHFSRIFLQNRCN